MREIRYRIRLQGEEGAPVLTIYPKLYDELNGLLHHPIDTNAWKILSVDEWTGLIDNNGVEIYEGDGLEDEYGNFFGFVIFEDGCFILSDDSLIWKLRENKLTVFGSIHEEK